MTDYEFELLLEDIRESLDPSIGSPVVAVYDASKDSPIGSIYHCDISHDHSRIVVNRDLLLEHYPYADRDTLRKMLLEEIERLRITSHGGK